MTEINICSKCRLEIPPSTYKYANGVPMFTNYGLDKNNCKVCYSCCGVEDKKSMVEQGYIDLYLANSRTDNFGAWRVTNWPNSLSFDVLVGPFTGAHNIARTRYDCWFIGPDDYIWWGVQYGDNTQIIHCKRTKYKKYVGWITHKKHGIKPPKYAMGVK